MDHFFVVIRLLGYEAWSLKKPVHFHHICEENAFVGKAAELSTLYSIKSVLTDCKKNFGLELYNNEKNEYLKSMNDTCFYPSHAPIHSFMFLPAFLPVFTRSLLGESRVHCGQGTIVAGPHNHSHIHSQMYTKGVFRVTY